MELGVERLAQRVDADLVGVLRDASADCKLAIVSDFHIPSPQFARMLRWHRVDDLFDATFVSCDSGVSKASGRLYGHVLSHLAADGVVDPDRVLMVGDHPVSDEQRAREAGLRTVRIERAPEEQRTPLPRRADEAWRHRRQLVKAALTEEPSLPFIELAATLFVFARELHDQARRDGADDLLFLAREGKILQVLFERLGQLSPGIDEQLIGSRYLVVSRRSTALASLRPIDEEDFAGLLDAYPGITTGDLLRSLGLLDLMDAGWFTDLDTDGLASRGTSQLLAHQGFRDLYATERAEQRELLMQYIDQTAQTATGPLNLVDVGWKGTMQDHLQKLVGVRRSVRGYYLGIVCQQPLVDGEKKHGILFDSRLVPTPPFRILRHFKSLYEYLLQAEHGSALRYRYLDGSIEPVLDGQEAEKISFDEHVAPFQDGLIKAFDRLCRADALSERPLIHGVDEAAEVHARMLFFPRRNEVELIQSLQHYENFGRMTVVRPGDAARCRKPSLASRLRFLRDPRRVLGSGWPPLTLSLAGLAALIPAVGVYRTVREISVPRIRRLGR